MTEDKDKEGSPKLSSKLAEVKDCLARKCLTNDLAIHLFLPISHFFLILSVEHFLVQLTQTFFCNLLCCKIVRFFLS